MKNKKKGFTLVELLAMLVVLGILIGITIPNMNGILKNQRVNTLKADAANMAEKAKIKVAKDNEMGKPGIKDCFVLTLDYLNDNDDFNKGPNGGSYDKYDSFVIYTREESVNRTTKFKFYVRLVEETATSRIGFDLVDSDEIDDLKKDNIVELADYGLVVEQSISTDILNNDPVKSKIAEKIECNLIFPDKYYTSKHN